MTTDLRHAILGDVLGVIMLAGVLAPALGPALAGAVLLDSWRSHRLTYRHVAGLIGCLGMVVWGWGAWTGHLWDLRGADEYCGGDLARAPTWWLLPLVHTCHLADGTARPLVPPIVDPVLLLCAVTGVLVVVRGRRRATRRP